MGISLRTISDKLLKFFGIKISHEGIRQWVLAAEDFNFKQKIPLTKNCKAIFVQEISDFFASEMGGSKWNTKKSQGDFW